MSPNFWQEEDDRSTPYQVPDDIVDVVYRVDCRMLPTDHAQALSHALLEALPWLAEEEDAAIHTIHVAESGNGWQRPDAPDDVLYLSRRTRMTLRVPKARVADALALTGRRLDIAGQRLVVGPGKVRLLSTQPVLFARYVAGSDVDDEERFLQEAYEQVAALGIRPRKMMPGRRHVLHTDAGPLATRSLMVADLGRDEAVRLQQKGIGPGRKLGCGIFLPHKGIEAVRQARPESA